jgi:Phosphate transporter family
VPAIMGKPFETLVPKPDADGLDEGGIALPELLAPLPDGLQHAQRCCRLPLGQWQVGWLVRAVPAHRTGTAGIRRPACVAGSAKFCAEAGGAITLFLATYFGIPVSTTHTITGAIVGVGAARKTAAVRWNVASDVVVAWIVTLPAAALFGAAFYELYKLLS